ncbi:MAG: hypothetical protein ACK52U_07880 [Synechococcaceae cyanobacterium]
MARRQTIRAATGCLALASALLLGACSGPGAPISAEGRARCQRRADLEEFQPLRPLIQHHCLSGIEAKLAEERREEGLRRQEHQRQLDQALRRCRQKQVQLLGGLRQLRQAELALARLRASREPALPEPPKRLNEAVLQRYTREDAELDRQRFRDAISAWQRRLAERQSLRQQRLGAIDEAQLRLDRAALRVRQLQPDLLAEGIELDPGVARRVLRCDPNELAATLPDAPLVVKRPTATPGASLPVGTRSQPGREAPLGVPSQATPWRSKPAVPLR